MSLLDLNSDETLAGLPLQVAVPKESKTSAWTAVPRGVGAAGAEVFADFTGLPQMQPDPADRQAIRFGRMPEIQKDPEARRKVGEQMTKAARDYAHSLRPDAAAASTADMVVFDLSRALTKGAAAVMSAGPLAGAGAFGASEGAATLDDMRRKGVDEATAQKVAGVTGALSAVGVALPVAGRTLAQTAALVVAGGPGSFAAQQALTREILRDGGHAKLAEQYNPADPLGLGLSLAVPGVFAAAAMRGAARSVASSKLVDTVKGIESNGQRYDDKGRLLTSPKGALGEMQVMPATARDPGFGIKPWDGQSLDDLARVGRDYLETMTKRYQGDTDKIMAAYNAGPGAVDKQVAARGAAWLDGMPAETRDYVAKGRRKMGSEPITQEATDAAMVANLRQSREVSNPRPGDDAAATRHESALVKAEEQLAAGEPVRVADVTRAEDFAIEPPRKIPSLPDFIESAKLRDDPAPPEVRGNFLAWINRQGGLSAAEKVDITGEANGVRANPGGIFRRGGVSSDDLALRAAQDGYLLPDQAGDTPAFVELVKRAVSGERILNMEEQGISAARGAHMADLDQRFAEVSRRLEALGIDTKPYRGNVAALEAYAKQYEPQLMRAAMDEATGQMPGASFSDFAEMMAKARSIANDVEEGGRTLSEFEADFGPLSPAMRRMVGDELTPIKETPAAQAEASAVTTRLDAIRADFPDLMVQMDGMDAPMRMDDFLAAVKADADEMLADAPLLQRAAECAIINGL